MRKTFNVKVLTEVAIFAALAFALDALQGGIFKGLFPNGGSIGIAMVPIIIIAYRHGLLAGISTGFILSIIQMIPGIYIINTNDFDNQFLKIAGPFIQVLLDYILAYTLVGFAGIFKKKYDNSNNKNLYLSLGIMLGGLLKYLCHILSGLFFWPGEIFGISGSMYSFIYNGLYSIPNIILSLIILLIINKLYPNILNTNGDNHD